MEHYTYIYNIHTVDYNVYLHIKWIYVLKGSHFVGYDGLRWVTFS